MELKDLVGRHMLSGVDFGYNNGANEVRFILDGNGYSASEDESDGWRSYLNDLNSFNGRIRNTFDETEVVIQEDDSDAGVFNFICSDNGKTVLRLGTDYSDSWYPVCVMEYTPENLPMNDIKKRNSGGTSYEILSSILNVIKEEKNKSSFNPNRCITKVVNKIEELANKYNVTVEI